MNLQEIRQKIRDLAEPVLERHAAFSVEVLLRVERTGKVIQIFADTDSGITIDKCALIARELRSVLEPNHELVGQDFHIEVSSPGLDRPLKYLRQYPKNIGRVFNVKFQAEDGSSQVKGTLTKVDENVMTFQPEHGEPLSIEFDRIIESREELPW